MAYCCSTERPEGKCYDWHDASCIEWQLHAASEAAVWQMSSQVHADEGQKGFSMLPKAKI